MSNPAVQRRVSVCVHVGRRAFGGERWAKDCVGMHEVTELSWGLGVKQREDGVTQPKCS